MNDRALRIALAGLSLAGLAVTGYLLSVRWGGAPLYCTTSGCETVQNSSYAVLLGIPVAAAGFLSYLALGASALTTHPLALAGAALFGLVAVAFSAYLLVIQMAVIDAVCQWCVVGDVITVLLAAVVLLRFRDVAGAHSEPSSSPAESA